MNEERLLERIRAWESEPDRRGRADSIRQVDSILAHLWRILNTRQGGVPISDAYGIPDLNDFLTSYSNNISYNPLHKKEHR